MMFRELTNFGLKRTAVQALGFYLAYLLFIMLLGGLAGFVFVLLFGPNSVSEFTQTVSIGATIGALVCAFLTYSVRKEKHVAKQYSTLIYVIVSFALGIIGGGLLGLTVPSYLTTKDPSSP
jgi:hypothetical protein